MIVVSFEIGAQCPTTNRFVSFFFYQLKCKAIGYDYNIYHFGHGKLCVYQRDIERKCVFVYYAIWINRVRCAIRIRYIRRRSDLPLVSSARRTDRERVNRKLASSN